MRISELKSPYKELAELMRVKRKTDELIGAFDWGETPEGTSFWRDVDKGEYPPIPAESLKELGEWVIGQEYEFSSCNDYFYKGKLLAIVAHEFKYISDVYEGYGNPTAWKQIRHIQPQVKEVTIEEIAEKFGVSVESIKIKK